MTALRHAVRLSSPCGHQGEVTIHLRQVHQEGAKAFALLPDGLREAAIARAGRQ